MSLRKGIYLRSQGLRTIIRASRCGEFKRPFTKSLPSLTKFLHAHSNYGSSGHCDDRNRGGAVSSGESAAERSAPAQTNKEVQAWRKQRTNVGEPLTPGNSLAEACRR